MPITTTRIAPCLYHTRYEGQYSDDEILEQAQTGPSIIKEDIHDVITITEIIGEYRPPTRLETSRLVAEQLKHLKLSIVVGLPKKNQMLSQIQFDSMGLGHKIAFFDTMAEAIEHAKKLLAEDSESEQDT